MSNLRLGAYKLPAAEVVLIQTLFRLYSHGGDFNWAFVTAPPYDALLVDGASSDADSPEVARMARSILRLTRMNGEAGPDTLQRPIRADKLQDWLNSVSYGFQDTRPVAQTSTPASEPPPQLRPRRPPSASARCGSSCAAGPRRPCCAATRTASAWPPCFRAVP